MSARRTSIAPIDVAYFVFALIAVLGLVLGVHLIWAIWQLDAHGVSYVTRKSPTFDFANIWMGGRLALEGRVETIFDVAAYRATLDATLGVFRAPSEWSYPPGMLVLALPFGLMPINVAYVAYVAWTAMTIALLMIVLRRNDVPLLACALLCVSPAVLQNVAFGQNGAFTAALLFGGLMASERQPILAGLCLGVLTVKPQIGLLAPVCLLASGRYAAIAWSALFAVLVNGAAAALFGLGVWTQFFSETAPLMTTILEAPYLHPYQQVGVSVFLLARALGADLPLAYGVQLASALCAVAAVWALWRRSDVDPALRAATTGVLTLLATPYGYTYELIALPLATLLLAGQSRPPAAGVVALLFAFWLWPRFSGMVTNAFLPLTPVVSLLIAGACLRALLWPATRSRAGQAAATPR